MAELQLVLERERLGLERERLEVERLRLELDRLVAASGAAGGADAPAGSAAARRSTGRLASVRPGGARRPGAAGARPGRPAGPPWGLIVAGAGALALVGFAFHVASGGRRDPGPVAAATPGEVAPERAPSGGGEPGGRPQEDPALVARFEALHADVRALPAAGPARSAALAAYEAELRSLLRSDLARTRRDALEALGDTLDALRPRPEAPPPRPTAPSEPVPPVAADDEPIVTDDEPIVTDDEPDVPLPAREPPGRAPAPVAGRPGSPARGPDPGLDDEDDEGEVGPEAGARDPRAFALLTAAVQAYDRPDLAALARHVADLEERGAGLPETQAARGLLRFLRHDLAGAVEDLLAAGETGGVRVADALARAAFATMRYDEARAAAERLPPPERAAMTALLDGPFARLTPHAAPALETITPDGRYRVLTDLGLQTNALLALDQRIGQAATPADRDRLVAQARRKHEGLAELADTMDKAYRAYSRLFSEERPPDVRPSVYVFQHQADFARFSQLLGIGSTEHVLGYYMPGLRVLVFYDHPGSQRERGRHMTQETLETLLHETFHQWLHLYVDDAPPWLNEGLAEYFGFSRITAKGLQYGLVPKVYPSRLDDIRTAIGGTDRSLYPEPLPLSTFLRADQRQFMNAHQAGVNYAHAWSFVHFLAATKGGQKVLRDYFHTLRAGKSQDEAFREVFGPIDLLGLEREWKDYVGKLR